MSNRLVDDLAEQVALLYGWTGITNDDSDRAKALHIIWARWYEAYRASGGKVTPRAHPELSDARIHELAEERRAVERKMREKLDELVEVG